MENIKKMLGYYGFDSVEAFGKSVGLFNTVDAEKMLAEMYEEDILWDE